MNPEFSDKQLARLTPEAVRVIDQYRKTIKRATKKTPSINGAINRLIVGATSIEHDRCWRLAFSVIDGCELLTLSQQSEILKRLDKAMNSKADQNRQLKAISLDTESNREKLQRDAAQKETEAQS